jgi:hypothetical protein
MNTDSSEFLEDHELTEAAFLIIVRLPVDETVNAPPAERFRYAILSPE